MHRVGRDDWRRQTGALWRAFEACEAAKIIWPRRQDLLNSAFGASASFFEPDRAVLYGTCLCVVLLLLPPGYICQMFLLFRAGCGYRQKFLY